jgi:hypothetical protein
MRENPYRCLIQIEGWQPPQAGGAPLPNRNSQPAFAVTVRIDDIYFQF